MSPEKQRIAIATACGWTDIRRQNLYRGDRDLYGTKLIGAEKHRLRLPDYPNDLNACHEMEKDLSTAQLQREYADILDDANGGHFATAAQRSEAFLRTLGLWTETPTQPQ